MLQENSKTSRASFEDIFFEENVAENQKLHESELKTNEDQLDEKENELATQLKTNCDKNGNELNHRETALLLHQLGKVYHRRSANQISLIRSAVLYNAAIARAPENVTEIEENLKSLCEKILALADAKLTKDLIQKSRAVKKKLKRMRNYVNKQLDRLQPIKENDSKQKIRKQEKEKAEFIEKLQSKITKKYKQIMYDIAKFCNDVMGESPCQFALAGMGSLARKEITPYSDFEHIILLQNNAMQNISEYKKSKILNYFRWFSVIFQIVLINLQETIVPSVAIPSLNDYSAEESNWFYDNFTTKGVSFDGMMPHACKFPLGRQHHTKDKPWETELIRHVEDMLNYLSSEENLKNGYHLGDVLTKTCFVFGDQTLYNLFKDGVCESLNNQYQQYLKVVEKESTLQYEYDAKQNIRSQIANDLQEYATRSTLFQVYLNKTLNIKKVVYRSTTLFVAALGRVCNVHASSCFEVIKKLFQVNELSVYAKDKLMYALAVACVVRLRWYMKTSGQTDKLQFHSNGNKPIEILISLVGLSSIVNYFQIAYALQSDLSKRLRLKKIHFYSNPKLLNLSLFHYLNDSRCVGECLLNYTDTNEHERLNNFDKCLKELEMENFQSSHPNLTQETSKAEKMIAKHFYNVGVILKEKETYDDAIEYFLIAREILKRKRCSQSVLIASIKLPCSDVEGQHSAILSACLHDLGYCYLKLLRPRTALKYLEDAFYHSTQIVEESERERKKVDIFYRIGSCYVSTYEFTKAKQKLYQALKLADEQTLNISSSIKADIQMEIGGCLFLMNKLEKAKQFFEKALQIKDDLYKQERCFKKRSDLLCDLGRCAFFLKKKKK